VKVSDFALSLNHARLNILHSSKAQHLSSHRTRNTHHGATGYRLQAVLASHRL
jgi:hypothetical protein